jgi:hypothetical protein
MRAGRYLGAVGLIFMLGLALGAGAGASAEVSFCGFGSGAGQCEKPAGLAVDPVAGNVYVADQGNNRVDVFDSAGGFLFAFGGAGAGSGQFAQPQGIAIDRNPASLSYRDVYVFDGNNFRVQKFDREGNFLLEFGSKGSGSGQFARADNPIAVGPGGTVYVGDSENIPGNQFASRIERFDPNGNFLGSSKLLDGDLVASIAIDSGGFAYVARGSRIEKYELSEPNATQIGSPVGIASNTSALAVDSSDHIFAMQREPSGGRDFVVITEYDSALSVLSRFGYGAIDFNLNGLAVAGAENGVYGSEEYVGVPSPGNRVLLVPEAPEGPLACCAEAPPASISNTKATIKAGVDPEGEETTYHFEYVDQQGFNESGFLGPTVKKTPESASVGSDFTLHPVEVQIGCLDPVKEAAEGKCLTPETTYHFRVVATDHPGLKSNAAEGEFTTKPPLEILDTFSTEVGTDAAQLHATVDPLGITTSGYFEYVDDASFKANGNGFTGATRIPSSNQTPLDFGSGAAKTRFVQLASLVPGTLYHYRVIAFDPLVTIQGPERTFTTFPLPNPPEPVPPCENAAFRSGPSAPLPDCRAYELVSPVNKNGGDIAVLKNLVNFPSGLYQGSTDGNRFAYSSATAFGGAVSAPYSSQYIATRKEGEQWSTQPISPPRESESIANSYAVKLDTQFKAFSPNLGSSWLVHDTNPPLGACAPAGFLSLYRRDNDSGGYEALSTAAPSSPQTPGEYWPELEGLSADGAHAVFRANGALTKNASSATNSSGPIEQLYEHVSGKGCGQLRLISILPNGQASTLSSAVGAHNDALTHGGEGRENTVARAVSADGSRIFWSTPPAQAETVPGPLYVRIGGQKTVQISAGPARFWTASTNGSKAFYTVPAVDSVGTEGELYEFEVDSEVQTLIAKRVVGVAEASEDGSRIYFVSKEALGGEGEAGKPNLYLRGAGGATSLIGTLGAAETPGGEGGSFPKSGFTVAPFLPNRRGTRATPDGAHLAFVSTAPLTGYDNKDATDGRRDYEVFLFDAGTGKLACISCNPSGARPAGREFKFAGVVIRVAAQMAPSENQLFAPRNLSEDGNRLFFESFEPLVPRDDNGKGDVYEWERAGGQQECDAKGAELFVPSAGGCLSLISSGQSPTDSVLADATPSGNDVFIKTGSSLLPQDPGLVDVYDARVEGGLPVPPEPKPPCEGEACQIPSSPPEDPTPASSVFEGAGDLKPRCPKGKRKVRRAGKVRCIPKHKRHAKQSHHGRAAR